MNLNDLLAENGIDATKSKHVLVMRHRPSERTFRKVLPWLAAEEPDLYNAYQQAQGENSARAMKQAKYLVSVPPV